MLISDVDAPRQYNRFALQQLVILKLHQGPGEGGKWLLVPRTDPYLQNKRWGESPTRTYQALNFSQAGILSVADHNPIELFSTTLSDSNAKLAYRISIIACFLHLTLCRYMLEMSELNETGQGLRIGVVLSINS